MRRSLTLIVVALMAAVPAAPADAAKRRPAKKQLSVFRSCDGLVALADRRVDRFGSGVFSPRRGFPTGGLVARQPARRGGDESMAVADAQGGAAAPTAAPVEGTDFSGTNVQEKGIDEPDAVKTDGRRIYVAINEKLHAIDVTGDTPRLVASLPLEGYGHELLLRKGKLIVLSSAGFDGPIAMPDVVSSEPVARPSSQTYAPYVPRTKLMEVDADDLEVLRTLELPGSVVGGRMKDGTARIAVATPTGVLPSGAPEFRRWMPAMELTRESSGTVQRRSIAPCTSVRRPQIFAGLGLLTVLTIDVDEGLNPVDSDAILADASTVYASANRLFLATERWLDPEVAAQEGAPVGRSTTIHGFDVSGDTDTRYVGSGNLPGYLLNQFSLSEHKGALRAATTEDPPWIPGTGPDGESESFVTVLDERDGRLAQVGRVGGLGKGERIFAVRFVEDVGFVVTFRQTDPLYTLDLSDRTAPRVVGELKIPGYSAYLHPIGDDLLIGVGQDANEQGMTRGAQVSLFDVGDLRNPRRLHAKSLGRDSFTTAEHDHHAFLWWAPTRLMVLPLDDYDGEDYKNHFRGAVGMRVDRAAGFTETGRIVHPEQNEWRPDIVRSLVAGDRIYSISYLGLQAGRLDTLAGTSWVPFTP